MSQQSLNLGILAHVDAGKTTLTERLLHAAGVIDEPGSVDHGTTQTDTLALERQRGITIRSAVASFAVGDVTVNLVDTPGHPDFVAEVERALAVLDGAVLVVSAVEGVQAQTRLLMRALRRLHVPTLVFVNKIDRAGADDERVLRELRERLGVAVVPVAVATGLGTRAAAVSSPGADDATFRAALAEALAEHDDALLAAYLDGAAGIPYGRLREALAAQTARGLVHPVFLGSAVTGAGVEPLLAGLAELLPAAGGDPDGPVRGLVFKIERGATGEKLAYVRMVSGTVRVRDRVRLCREGRELETEAKVTGVELFAGASPVRSASVGPGQIGRLLGLAEARIGDALGGPPPSRRPQRSFAPPTLESVVVPRSREDEAALHAALDRLAEQDPLIRVRRDDRRRELAVSLYGEVQKEVIGATLAADFGIEVEFRETTPICIERVVGSGAAVEVLGRGSPFLATLGLRLERTASGSGFEFRSDVPIGSVPLYVYGSAPAFTAAIEETVRETLGQGLHGWAVHGCAVTLTHSGYSAPATGAGDFRKLTPLVLMEALKEARTEVCEPIHRFHLTGPAESLRSTLRVLAQLRADPQATTVSGSAFAVEGEIAAGRMHLLQRQVGRATRGEGVLELDFDRYEPVAGELPTRARSDFNPLNRKEYLLHVQRRL